MRQRRYAEFVEVVHAAYWHGFARWERRLEMDSTYAVMDQGWRFVGWRHKPRATTYNKGWVTIPQLPGLRGGAASARANAPRV